MEAYSPLIRRATVVLPVPGLPRNTMCRLIGGTGRSFCARSLRTLTRLMRFLTSFFTLSSPTRDSSCAIRSSKSGFSGSLAALSADFSPLLDAAVCGAAPAAAWACFSVKGAAPLVT